ncbi:DUF6636 domain-containing protein [Hoeflea sp.]|uniref:DUF6636 domain-containing protein n=1 Tax=Hoeflea sp. TaxID=1940281 RepID=UPI003BB15CB2
MKLKLLFAAATVAICLPNAAGADGYGFMTPSGNIYCNGAIDGGGYISCTIVARKGGPAMPKPASCSGVWGHEFELDATGPARLACGGQPEKVDYGDIAEYGLTGDFGAITCKSEKTGLTCRNRSGHGFFLSRGEQSMF